MAAIGGREGPFTSARGSWMFADLVLQSPQAIPKVSVPFRQPKHVDGQVFVQFS